MHKGVFKYAKLKYLGNHAHKSISDQIKFKGRVPNINATVSKLCLPINIKSNLKGILGMDFFISLTNSLVENELVSENNF